ncbi:MAG: glycine-rich domain-containing protein [Paracoccaceae bacterium]
MDTEVSFGSDHGPTDRGAGSALSEPALWSRLEAFEIDDRSAGRDFTARLAEETGWSRATAEAAILEYKRFLYLAMVSDRPVTPSIAVDLVWHQHLAYSRSYWERLCPEVLGRALHHEPTAGGPDERARYLSQYEQTLRLYAAEFGAPPPRQFWPSAAQRFAAKAQPRLYAPATHFLIQGGMALWLGALMLALTLAALDALFAWPLFVMLGVSGAVWAIRRLLRRARRGRSGSLEMGVGLGTGVAISGDSDGDGDSGCGGGCGD